MAVWTLGPTTATEVSFWPCSVHSHKVLDGCLERCSCLASCLLAGCVLNEGARQSLLLAGDNACLVWCGEIYYKA